jgi:NADH:ubiquinone oxidoreductase subunit D
VNIGSYSFKTVLNYGLTGVLSRSVGVKRDLRISKLETYSNYYYLNFRSFVGNHGDCYDRFLIRMCEMSESLNICNQILMKIKDKNIHNTVKKNIFNKHHVTSYLLNNNNCNSYSSMEEIIKHFKN